MANILKNTVQSAITGIIPHYIDELLPFENKVVWIWDISYRMRGYGHWMLALDIEIDGTRQTFKALTTDSLIIDYWNGMDGREHSFLDANYIGKLDAIETVLRTNLYELEELA